MHLSVSGANDAVTVVVKLKPKPKLRNLESTINFNEMLIKGRSSIGNVVTKFPILKVVQAGIKPSASPQVTGTKSNDGTLPLSFNGGEKVQMKLSLN